MKLTSIEKKILNTVQYDFPVTAKPYKAIAVKFGITEEKVLEIFKRLKKSGLIRRITPIFHIDKMGGVSVLAAAQIPDGKIECAGRFINKFEEITHNYVRDHKYNFWFTIMSSSSNRIRRIIKEIEKEFNAKVLTFPKVKTYKRKIAVKF